MPSFIIEFELAKKFFDTLNEQDEHVSYLGICEVGKYSRRYFLIY